MTKWITAILALFPIMLSGQTVTPIVQPHAVFLNSAGIACAGCSLYTYAAGTTTPQATYVDATGTSQNTNPIILGADGGANIWVGTNSYKFVLKDTTGATVWTVDQVPSWLGFVNATFLPLAGGMLTGPLTGTTATFSTVSASVNGVFNVAAYGAVGDCTGGGSTSSCTDNHTAIQNAINAAYAVGGAVYFPTNPANTNSQTIYYTSVAINPKGVSMYGPPGASGPGNYYLSTLLVGVRGAPSKDVFALVDAADAGYVQPLSSFAVRDLAIIVDDSQDASSTFTYRKPGRICQDVTTNGTAIITSATQCIFQPGDVGQAVTVGSTTTTILSYQSPTQVTLNTTVTTGTNVSAYISALGQSVTQRIGNCGFAYPDRAGTNSYGQVPYKSDFTNMVIQTTDNASANNTCGFFFQGNQAPTWTRWTNVTVVAWWGFVYVPQNQAAPTTTQWAGSTDFNTWQNVLVNAKYPFLLYSAGYGTISAMQIVGADAGPQIITAYGAEFPPLGWSIDVREMEPDASCASANTALRISGYKQTVEHFQAAMCSSNPGTIQWDASSSTLKDFYFTHIANLNITGDLNDFVAAYGGDALTQNATPNITGRGNTFGTGYSTNPFGGHQAGRSQYYGLQNDTFGPPTLSHGGKAFNRDSSFVAKGAASYYFNDQDLWIWPNELFGIGAAQPVPVADSASETGQNFATPNDTAFYLYGANGTNFYIGSQIPAGKFRLYAKIKSASTSNWTIDTQANTGSFGSIGCNATFSSIGTSYTIVSCDADATGLTGDEFRIYLLTASAIGNVAWIAIRPWDTTTLTDVIFAGGTAPTVTGCGTISSPVGGATAGTFVTSTTSCTPVLTALPAAPHGYSCFISDQTHPFSGNLLPNISSTTTTATFGTFTTTASDVLAFSCPLNF